MTPREKIAMGECQSELTVERCPYCVDTCDAAEAKRTYNKLIKDIDKKDEKIMEAKELRIWNLAGWNGRTYRVIAITENGVTLLSDEEIVTFQSFDKVNPIPLTGEWLENTDELEADILSFEHPDYDWWFISEWEVKNNWYLFIHDKPTVQLPYVHTYQNAIRSLTGKELTIHAAQEKD